MANDENPTKQRKASVGKGGVPTPVGFEAHPERRHNGAWKKEDTPRYKLEQMMKLSEAELLEIKDDPGTPLFERKLTTALIDGNWKEIESMINQVYGQPKIPTDITSNGKTITPLLVEFVDNNSHNAKMSNEPNN